MSEAPPVLRVYSTSLQASGMVMLDVDGQRWIMFPSVALLMARSLLQHVQVAGVRDPERLAPAPTLGA